ncbi:GDYXXLXY domain-containing protein [Bacillus sp. B190/17]|uniref:GDYXXLXY domain-containing protein n=1 Tax=Bacillus lumedeiriae TaxID=3058829 RepID=A0ABW8I9D9_9BACI
MLSQKRGDIPYILGLIFLLAGVVYFFASNWPLLDRPAKIALSMMMIVVSFTIAIIYKKSATFAYLSNWWLLVSAISFGISTALVGQTYNSHADSYLLFLIWLIPVILLAFFTNYRPFFWLALLLFELTIWMKIYPTSIRIDYSTHQETSIYLAMTAIHLLIFYALRKTSFEKLGFVTLIVAQYCALFLLNKHSIYDLFSNFSSLSIVYFIFHGIYIVLLLFFWRKFINERKSHPVIMAVHLLFFGIYLIYNTFLIYIMVFGETVFYTGFLLLIAVFGFSVYTLKKLSNTVKETDKKWSRYTYKFFVGTLSFLGTIIAIASISSFTALVFGFGTGVKYGFLIIGAICVVGGLSIRKSDWTVIRLTLQMTGIALLFFFAYMHGETWVFWLLAILFVSMTAVLFRLRDVLLYYLAMNGAVLSAILSIFWDSDLPREWIKLIFLVFGLVNAALFSKWAQQRLGLLAYLLSLGYFFAMTVGVEEHSTALAIGLHLIFAAYFYFHLTYPKSSSRLYLWVTWAAVTVFFIWKYYEFVWKLLHKSLAFFIVSFLFFLIFYLWGKKHTEKAQNILKWSWKPAAVLLVLQLVFIGFTAWQKEQLLKNGELIALQLEPLDPRSLLQGDYVQLNYAVHTAYQNEQQNGRFIEGKIHVQLEQTAEQVPYHGKYVAVYKPVHFTKADQPAVVNEKTVTIQGKARYGNINLGIEHFFIPENTGVKWEDKNIALVRVAENGDALLETLIKR